jgi:hypothetical protein
LKKFAWLGPALVICLLLLSGASQAQHSQGSPFDGMSAIDIEVAAALRKQDQEPHPTSSQLEIPAGTTPPVSFLQCDIVELRGRFMHEGWFPIPGNPLPGPATLQATLTGPLQTAEFRLIDVNEGLLQSLELDLADEAPDGKTYLGSFDVPDEPFKFAVSGVDDQDAAYDVVCPRVFQPRTIDVRFDALFNLVEPGVVPLSLVITNHGPSGTFLLSVEDDMGVGATIDDLQVELEQDESKATTVNLNVPAITVGVLDITVTATATSETDNGYAGYGSTLARVQKFNLILENGFESPQSEGEGPP